MIFQQPQARVCSGSQSLETSFRVAQSVAEFTQLNEALRHLKIGVAPGPHSERFPISREWARTLAADCADDESGVANSELRISRTSHCGSSGA
jgi:hypothetical protein